MREAQHTPGPWTADQSVTAGAVVAEVDRLFGAFITVRAVRSDMNKTTAQFDAESEANAALIAAAPELLEACKALIASPAGAEHYCHVPRGQGGFACPACLAQAAIAKATSVAAGGSE